ncbi:MAG: hypothetical protein KF893_20550 [Caldilineaceae bacterium]|nr:hypothetical protein [Caldilineaceae bacterium]
MPSPALLLIVCTGNICRSPMVMALIRQKLQEAGLSEQIEVRSAGTLGLEGATASRHGVELLAQRGIDLSHHRSRLLTLQEVEKADLILVMEESHRQLISNRSPEYLSKILLFHELVEEKSNLSDPYGGERDEYAATLARIDYVLDAGWQRLLAELGRT